MFRNINVQGVPGQRVEDVVGLVSVFEVQNVGDVPNWVALGIQGLDVEEDMLWLLDRCGCWRMFEARISYKCIRNIEGNLIRVVC